MFNFKFYNDILYLWHSEYISVLPRHRREHLSPSNIFIKFFRIVKVICKDFLEFLTKDSGIPKNSILVMVSTNNNYESVKFLENRAGFFFVKPMRVKNYFDKVQYVVKYRYKFFYDIFFPFFLFEYLKYTTNRNASIFWDYSINACGLYEESYRWISAKLPRAIVFSNDHSVEQRAMMNAAKEYGIPTIYIQHAAVSEFFPPLKFDLNLLEGNDSLNKYCLIGEVDGNVSLVGNAKADKFVKNRNFSPTVASIGICYSPNDDFELIDLVINFILSNFEDIRLSVRAHPADKRNFTFCSAVLVSDSKNVSSVEYFSSVDCIIAGDSSIHLEAVILNIYSIYYSFQKDKMLYDYYGFIKNCLIPEISNLGELNDLISSLVVVKPDVYFKAKYFVESVGTELEGNVEQRIFFDIVNFVNNWTNEYTKDCAR